MIDIMVRKGLQKFNEQEQTFNWRNNICSIQDLFIFTLQPTPPIVQHREGGLVTEYISGVGLVSSDLIKEQNYESKNIYDKAVICFNLLLDFKEEQNNKQIYIKGNFMDQQLGMTENKGSKRKSWQIIKDIFFKVGILKEGRKFKVNINGEQKEVSYIKSKKCKQYIFNAGNIVNFIDFKTEYGRKRLKNNTDKQYFHKIYTGYSYNYNGKTINKMDLAVLNDSQKSKKQSLKDGRVYSYQCLYNTNLLQKMSMMENIIWNKEGIIIQRKPFVVGDYIGQSSICKYGRLHTPLTKMTNNDFYWCEKQNKFSNIQVKVKKNQIKWQDNSQIIWIDIKNSQPLFLLMILLQNRIKCDDYKKDVEEGLLYQKIMQKCDQQNRDSMKEQLFRHVFFGPNKKEGKESCVELAFKELYNDVYSFICEKKKGQSFNDYKLFAQQLQKTQSNMVYQKIMPKIMLRDIKCVTVHDSFGIKEDNLEVVQNIIKEEFESLGIKVTLKVE